jgi:hypothetical protein
MVAMVGEWFSVDDTWPGGGGEPSDFEDLLLFLFEGLVDLLDVLVGQLLNFGCTALESFRNFGVLCRFFSSSLVGGPPAA